MAARVSERVRSGRARASVSTIRDDDRKQSPSPLVRSLRRRLSATATRGGGGGGERDGAKIVVCARAIEWQSRRVSAVGEPR